jgi:hypothetical protein
MELAALAGFAILVIAWIVAPDRPRGAERLDAARTDPQTEAQPTAA